MRFHTPTNQKLQLFQFDAGAVTDFYSSDKANKYLIEELQYSFIGIPIG